VHVLGLRPSIAWQDLNHRQVLVIQVEPTRMPVAYRGRYLTRVGSTNRDMTPEQLSRRLLAATGHPWDALPSAWGLEAVEPELLTRFVALAKDRLPGIRPTDTTERILQNLQLLRDDHLTNAGVLLFTRTPQALYPQARVRIGRFKHATILDSHDFAGSLWDQLAQAMAKFRDLLQVRFEAKVEELSLEGLQRREVWEYPLEALREALLNAIMHRDYTVPADVQVRLEDDRLLCWSPGGLPVGIRLEQLREPEHPSIPRNPLIAQVFYYARFIERWGTGTTRILEWCRAQGLPEPMFEEYAGGFRATFSKDVYAPERLRSLGLDERQIQIIQAVRESGHVRLGDLKRSLPELSDKTVQRELQKLVQRGLLRATGAKRGRRYELAQ
jgi:ATP-dependent DNA helicase RecG